MDAFILILENSQSSLHFSLLRKMATTDQPYLVRLTFVPATSTENVDGSMDDPIITIYADPDNTQYAFPLLTERIASIYNNILSSFIHWEMEYSPNKVVILVPISDLGDVDILRDQSNFDVSEGEGWGDLSLDDESLTFYNPDLEGNGEILYIPFLDDVEVLKKDQDGNWNSF